MKLRLLSGQQVMAALKRMDFKEIHRKGSHLKMKHPDGRKIIFPYHDEVDRYTLKGALLDADIDINELKYLYYCLLKLDLNNLYSQSGVPGLNRNDAYRFKIPLPPLSVQKEIVADIEGYQKKIEEAKQFITEQDLRIQERIEKVWGT